MYILTMPIVCMTVFSKLLNEMSLGCIVKKLRPYSAPWTKLEWVVFKKCVGYTTSFRSNILVF